MDKLELKKYIEDLIQKDQLWRFYKTKDWMSLRDEVLAENHNECALCKKYGRITRYDIDEEGNKHLIRTVHHNQFVRKHPELALSRTYEYKGKTYVNLIPVCKACHNVLHPEKAKKNRKPETFWSEERW